MTSFKVALVLNIFIPVSDFRAYSDVQSADRVSQRKNLLLRFIESCRGLQIDSVQCFIEIESCRLNDFFQEEVMKLFDELDVPNICFNDKRIDGLSEWQEIVDKLSSEGFGADDLVLFVCNEDHPFYPDKRFELASIPNLIHQCSKKFGGYVGSPISHWPEHILALGKDIQCETESAFVIRRHSWFDESIQWMNFRCFKYWWYGNEFVDAWWPRSDPPVHHAKGRLIGRLPKLDRDLHMIVPKVELARHYDGYVHDKVSLPAWVSAPFKFSVHELDLVRDLADQRKVERSIQSAWEASQIAGRVRVLYTYKQHGEMPVELREILRCHEQRLVQYLRHPMVYFFARPSLSRLVDVLRLFVFKSYCRFRDSYLALKINRTRG